MEMNHPERLDRTNELGIVIRDVHEDWEYRACLELQKATWGNCPEETIYRTTMIISQKVGGITAGAFDKENHLLGLVFGLTGIREGHLAHWSHLLAIREDLRGKGLGRRLKLYQRRRLLDMGCRVMFWTYDPLVARNAHFNLNRLGASVSEYILDMYGADPGDKLSQGIGTDRFIVKWRLDEEHVVQLIDGKKRSDTSISSDMPVVNTRPENGDFLPFDGELIEQPQIRIEVPENILSLQQSDIELASLWRTSTRRAFLFYMNKDYHIHRFFRDPMSRRCFYILIKNKYHHEQ